MRSMDPRSSVAQLAVLSLLGIACSPSSFDGYVLDVDAPVPSSPGKPATPTDPNTPSDSGSPSRADAGTASPVPPTDGGTASPVAVAAGCGMACPKPYRTFTVAWSVACGGTTDCTSQANVLCCLEGEEFTLTRVEDAPCGSGTHEIVRVPNDCPRVGGHDGGTAAVCAPN
jgi:hypothetical protein